MNEVLKLTSHALGMKAKHSTLMRMIDDMKSEHKSQTFDQVLAQADLMLLQAAVYR
jgi:hypothetical protein